MQRNFYKAKVKGSENYYTIFRKNQQHKMQMRQPVAFALGRLIAGGILGVLLGGIFF